MVSGQRMQLVVGEVKIGSWWILTQAHINVWAISVGQFNLAT